jgi:hypothetical protein
LPGGNSGHRKIDVDATAGATESVQLLMVIIHTREEGASQVRLYMPLEPAPSVTLHSRRIGIVVMVSDASSPEVVDAVTYHGASSASEVGCNPTRPPSPSRHAFNKVGSTRSSLQQHQSRVAPENAGFGRGHIHPSHVTQTVFVTDSMTSKPSLRLFIAT